MILAVLIDPEPWRRRLDQLRADAGEVGVTIVISAVSLFELLRWSFRRGNSNEARESILALRENPVVEIRPLTIEIAERAAGFAHGLGLHTSDALILATCVDCGCEVLLTTDRQFEVVENSIIKVEFL